MNKVAVIHGMTPINQTCNLTGLLANYRLLAVKSPFTLCNQSTHMGKHKKTNVHTHAISYRLVIWDFHAVVHFIQPSDTEADLMAHYIPALLGINHQPLWLILLFHMCIRWQKCTLTNGALLMVRSQWAWMTIIGHLEQRWIECSSAAEDGLDCYHNSTARIIYHNWVS